MRAPELLLWAWERILKRLGRLDADQYNAKHRKGFSRAGLEDALGDRVRDIGIQQPAEPEPDASTVRIPPAVVQVIAGLREWKREVEAEEAAEPVEPDPAETGIGILKPVMDEDEEGMCTSTHAVYDGEAPYMCEQLLVEHDPDNCTAGEGAITWPRTEMAVA